jgi:hypothetical protein
MVGLLAAINPAAAQQPRSILMLNSYRVGYPWTDETTRGLQAGLKDIPQEWELFVEFMDLRRHPDREEFESYIRKRYASKRIDIVIAADDEALEFVLDTRAELFPKSQFVFCGVDNRSLL